MSVTSHYHALIDNKPFFYPPLKNKKHMTIQQETYLFRSIKIFYIHWHRFIKTNKYNYSSQINFTEKLDQDDGATVFIPEKQQKAILNFSLDSLNAIE